MRSEKGWGTWEHLSVPTYYIFAYAIIMDFFIPKNDALEYSQALGRLFF